MEYLYKAFDVWEIFSIIENKWKQIEIFTFVILHWKLVNNLKFDQFMDMLTLHINKSIHVKDFQCEASFLR